MLTGTEDSKELLAVVAAKEVEATSNAITSF